MHHCMVWTSHKTGQEQTKKNSQDLILSCPDSSPDSFDEQILSTHQISRHYHCRPISPCTQLVPTLPLWEALKSKFLSTGVPSDEHLNRSHSVCTKQSQYLLLNQMHAAYTACCTYLRSVTVNITKAEGMNCLFFFFFFCIDFCCFCLFRGLGSVPLVWFCH